MTSTVDSSERARVDLPLVGKTIAVTGSSSGIGQEIAIELARQGADLILHGRSRSLGSDATEEQIRKLGRQAWQLFADFADHESLNGFVQEAWNWRGRIDGWINNAGGDVLTGHWKEQPLEAKLQYLWQIDVAATFTLSRAVGTKMVEFHVAQLANQSEHQNGRFVILNMGWDQAWSGMAGESGELFATTKGAIMAMSKSLAQSLAPAVRVNCLAPGWIQTKWGQAASDYWDQRAKAESLMHRWGQPADVAQVAAFLCSDAGGFINGQVIPVNGGFRFQATTDS